MCQIHWHATLTCIYIFIGILWFCLGLVHLVLRSLWATFLFASSRCHVLSLSSYICLSSILLSCTTVTAGWKFSLGRVFCLFADYRNLFILNAQCIDRIEVIGLFSDSYWHQFVLLSSQWDWDEDGCAQSFLAARGVICVKMWPGPNSTVCWWNLKFCSHKTMFTETSLVNVMLDADAVIKNPSQKVGGSNAYPDPGPKKVERGSGPRKTHRIYAPACCRCSLDVFCQDHVSVLF